MESMNEILTILQNASPIGVIALLVLVVYTIVKNQRIEKVATNHISCLPELNESMKRIEQSLIRIEHEMGTQTNMLTKIDVRVNRR